MTTPSDSDRKEIAAFVLEEVAKALSNWIIAGSGELDAHEAAVELRERAASLRQPRPEGGGVELYRQRGAPISIMGGEVFEYERDPAAEDVIAAFRNADEKDWLWLFNHLGHSGHGQFWRTVLAESKNALSRFDSSRGGQNGG